MVQPLMWRWGLWLRLQLLAVRRWLLLLLVLRRLCMPRRLRVRGRLHLSECIVVWP